MLSVLTPAEMKEVDSEAAEPTDTLIRRAGAAVCHSASRLMGGNYGRRVLVVAGPGNNGADGRVAAELLRRQGAHVLVIDAADLPDSVEEIPSGVDFDLVIDAAFGTGFHGTFSFPSRVASKVLAVDMCSGLSGLTGAASGNPARADETVTFAALKPGLLLGAGPQHSGRIRIADIGLDASRARIHLVEDSDLSQWVPDRLPSDHKWKHAVWLVAGSPGMTGAARLASAASYRAGAGYVRLTVPGASDPSVPTEVVHQVHGESDWAAAVVEGADRFGVIAAGPGLGRSDATRSQVRQLAAASGFTLVLDGDALVALGTDAAAILSKRASPTVLTPHDGEFEAMVGYPPGDDRIHAARQLSAATGAVVLLKGPTTVIAEPDGEVLLVRVGGQRLATAGTGDVLTGVVSGHLALGAQPLLAAAAGAHLHGRAAELGFDRGLIASDLIDLLPAAWDEMSRAPSTSYSSPFSSA